MKALNICVTVNRWVLTCDINIFFKKILFSNSSNCRQPKDIHREGVIVTISVFPTELYYVPFPLYQNNAKKSWIFLDFHINHTSHVNIFYNSIPRIWPMFSTQFFFFCYSKNLTSSFIIFPPPCSSNCYAVNGKRVINKRQAVRWLRVSISWTHIKEVGENGLRKIVLWLPHICAATCTAMCTHCMHPWKYAVYTHVIIITK